MLLKSTGSEFAGFLRTGTRRCRRPTTGSWRPRWSTQWRYAGLDVDWDKTWADVRRILLEQFATVHSLALQQTLWEMGRAVLEAHPEISEISLPAPNKHHFLVDLSPFGLENPNEVFYAADRPYGLIEATVVRENATNGTFGQ